MKKYFNIQSMFLYCTLIACLLNSLSLPINPFLYISMILVICLFVKKVIKREIRLLSKENIIMLAILLLLLISSIFSKYSFNKEAIVLILVDIVMICGLFVLNDYFEYEDIYKIIIGFSVIVIIISFILAFFKYDFVYYGKKFTGIYSNPNLGGQITLISILILFYLLNNKKICFRIGILFLIIHIIFLFLNDNRNAILIICILIIISLFKKIQTKIQKKILILLFSILVIISTVFIFNNKKFISSSLNIDEYTKFEVILNDVSTERYAIWKESSYLISNNSFMGCGVNNLQSVAKMEIGNTSRIVIRGITATHNILIQVFIDGGFFTFLLFIIFLLNLLKDVYNLFIKNSLFSVKGFPGTLVIATLLFSFLDIGILNYLILTSYIFWTHSKVITANNHG